jgi:hypothetical protein
MLAHKQAAAASATATNTARVARPAVAARRPASSADEVTPATYASRTAAALLAAVALIAAPTTAPPAHAFPSVPSALMPDGGAAARQKLEESERSFEQSDTLKSLLERSEKNRDKNKRAVSAKYCARQAELGVGDCGGLKYVPGAVKGGKEKTPEFLAKLLGVEGKEIEYEASGKTIEQLLAADEARAVAREAQGAVAAE